MIGRSQESWVILLLEDLRDVALHENLPASAEAISRAIEVVRSEMNGDEGVRGPSASRSPPKSHH